MWTRPGSAGSELHMTPDTLVAIVVIAATTGAALVDLGTRRVPNALTMTLAAVGVGLAAASLGPVGLLASVAGSLVGALLMLPGHMLGATGAGDVKLLAAAGAFLGPAGTVRAFIVTAVAGGVLAMVVAVRRRRARLTVGNTVGLVAGRMSRAKVEDERAGNRFAYAPAIAIGVAVVALGW